MELMEVLYKRRSIRDYASEPVSKKTVNELLDAAVQAPSAVNSQPWAFVVIQDVATLKQLSDRCKEHLLAIISDDSPLSKYRDTLTDPGFNIFYNASTLVVICAKPSGHHPAEDCSLAAQNLMLAAYDKGLGTCPIGFARPWFQQPDGKQAINIGPEFDPVFPVIVGKPQGEKPPVARDKPEILHWA